jgi:uncharacterized damage-inducible protein DinB
MTDNIENLNELQILARYNTWANARLYECVQSLSDDDYRADKGAYFGSVHATLNHILVGDHLWSSRIMGEYHGLTGLDQILHDDFQVLKAARLAMDEHIIRLTDRQSVGLDGGLNKQVSYRSVKGKEKHESSVRHILLTMFNHQTHHRGQIHCLLTQLGIGEPPGLDLIIFLRELPD